MLQLSPQYWVILLPLNIKRNTWIYASGYDKSSEEPASDVLVVWNFILLHQNKQILPRGKKLIKN